MKQLASVLTILLVLTGLLIQANPVRGDVLESGHQEIFSIIVDPANAEPVLIEGESQFLLRETERQDGTVWTEFQVSAHGTGFGLWSGTPYEFHEKNTYSWIDPSGLAYRIDSRDIMRLISRGARPNVMITQTFSIIRDANGMYTFASTFDYDITGRGN